jgi:hypothetical protein
VQESKGVEIMAQKWEYLIEIPLLEDVRAYLNSMGEQGWELVTVADVGVEPAEPQVNKPTPLQFIFKRSKREA